MADEEELRAVDVIEEELFEEGAFLDELLGELYDREVRRLAVNGSWRFAGGWRSGRAGREGGRRTAELRSTKPP